MLHLRAATPDDAEDIAGIYAPYVVTSAVTFETTPPNTKEMRKRIADGLELYPWIVICDDEVPDVVLGFAYATAFRPRPAYRFTVSTAVYIAGQSHRQGLGHILYECLLETLHEQGFVNAIAAIPLPNEIGIDLHESVGFQRAGVYRQVGFKFGEWHDVGLWQKTLATAADVPEEPKPFPQVGVITCR